MPFMPTIEYTCQQCDHTFKRVALQGDNPRKPICPKCKSKDVKASIQSAALFNGISNFSTLAKDTN